MAISQKMEIPATLQVIKKRIVSPIIHDALGGANIWQGILNNVTQRDDMRESNLIVLGERGAGKRSLIQSINKHCVRATNKLIEVDKMASQYSALDFEFLYVKDMSEKDAIHGIVTAEDNLPRLNVWMLQEPEKKDLLKVTLKPDALDMTAALIVIDLDQPWDLKDSLYKWMRLLEEVIKEILNKQSLEKKTSLQKRIEKHIKSYNKSDKE
jgi:hypothetical protein